jgi:hypothetical protein
MEVTLSDPTLGINARETTSTRRTEMKLTSTERLKRSSK